LAQPETAISAATAIPDNKIRIDSSYRRQRRILQCHSVGIVPHRKARTPIGGLGQRNDKDAPKGQAGRNDLVRKLLIVGLFGALALAGAFVARIVTPTSPVISCASPPIFALPPATRSCIREPTVKLRGES
jgi:hypothetical protein